MSATPILSALAYIQLFTDHHNNSLFLEFLGPSKPKFLLWFGILSERIFWDSRQLWSFHKLSALCLASGSVTILFLFFIILLQLIFWTHVHSQVILVYTSDSTTGDLRSLYLFWFVFESYCRKPGIKPNYFFVPYRQSPLNELSVLFEETLAFFFNKLRINNWDNRLRALSVSILHPVES